MQRLLFATSGRATPPDDGGDGGDPATPTYAATEDPVLLALRPAGQRVAVRSVGIEGATNDTIVAAVVSAQAAQIAVPQGTSLAWDYIGPDYRVDTFIGPGTYNEAIGTGACSTLVNPTGDPADVLLWADGDGADGVYHSYGTSYIEGITFQARERAGDSYSPKYPWHITGGVMNIAAHCVFDTTLANPNTPGHGTAGFIGMDGYQGSTMIAYRCHFKAGEPKGFNLHGAADGSEMNEPITWCFIECTTEGDVHLSAGGGAVAGGRKNALYVIGCTGFVSIASTDQTDVYTDDPDIPVTEAASTTRGVTEWPIPTGGLSELWNANYYPSQIGQTFTYAPTVTDAADFTPPAGRLYATKVKPPYAMRGRYAVVQSSSPAGLFNAITLPVDTAYDRDTPPDLRWYTDMDATKALASGENLSAYYYWYSRYPGDNGWWIYSRFDGTATHVTGSIQLGQDHESYYSDNGTTWTPVPAGTRVPLVGLRDAY